jgi:hypothetical protein
MLSLRSPGRRALVGAAAVAATLAVGAVAYASIPDANGVIHACYNTGSNPSGALRVIDTDKGTTCSKNEKPLSWNQRGPTGPKGATGAAGANGTAGSRGPTGPKGATGPSGSDATVDGYSATNSHVVDAEAANGFTQEIVGLSGLPAGDYIVWATVTNDGGTDDMECSLEGPGGSLDPSGHRVRVDYPQTVTITAVVKDYSGGQIAVYCGKLPALIDDPPTASANIEALPVSTLQ